MADYLYHLRTRYWNDVKPPRDALPDLSHPLAQGLVGDWNMSEGEGLLAFDRAGTVRGSPNHGTLVNGPTWVGDRGGATEYVHTNTEHIALPAGTFGVGADNRTTVVWFYTLTTGTGTLLAQGANLAGQRWKIIAEPDALALRVSSGSRTWTATGMENAWHQIAVVLDGTSTTDTIGYMDGQALAIASTSARTLNIGAADARIGGDASQSEYLSGFIGQVLQYNVALAADDIAQLFSEPYAYYPRPRRSWYTSVSAVGVYPIFGGRHVIR